eukprot:6022704-Prymnesium_polylepis.1
MQSVVRGTGNRNVQVEPTARDADTTVDTRRGARAHRRDDTRAAAPRYARASYSCICPRRDATRTRMRLEHDVARPRGSWTTRNHSFSAVLSLALRRSIGTYCAACARRITGAMSCTTLLRHMRSRWVVHKSRCHDCCLSSY